MMATPRKRTLSKNLSQMKFMKRQTLENQDDEVDVGGILTEKWVVPDAPPAAKDCVEGTRIAGFAECEGLDTFGRFSYNGFNKDVERLTRSRVGGSPSIVEPEEDADIPAQEVAQRHEMMSMRGDRKRRREKHFEKCLNKWSSKEGREKH